MQEKIETMEEKLLKNLSTQKMPFLEPQILIESEEENKKMKHMEERMQKT